MPAFARRLGHFFPPTPERHTKEVISRDYRSEAPDSDDRIIIRMGREVRANDVDVRFDIVVQKQQQIGGRCFGTAVPRGGGT